MPEEIKAKSRYIPNVIEPASRADAGGAGAVVRGVYAG